MKNCGATRGRQKGAAGIMILMALFAADMANAEIGKEAFKGSCEDLNDFIHRAGVTDAGNQNHPRSAAWTTFEVTSAPYQLTSKAQKKEGQVCLESALTEVPRMFSVTYRVTRLEWQPFGSITKDCAAEKARWEKATEDRESRRRAAFDGIAERYNQAWASIPHKYQACAESESIARSNVGELAEKDIKQQAERIKAEMQAASNSAQGSPENGDAGLDCSKCLSR